MCGKESPKDEMDTITISVFLPKKGWGGDDIDLCDDCFDEVNAALSGLLTRKVKDNEEKDVEDQSNNTKSSLD